MPVREGFIDPEATSAEPQRPAEPPRPQPTPLRLADPPPPPGPPPSDPPSEEPSPLESEWPIRIRLRHHSIYGTRREKLEELVFREPTGGDIVRIGNPVWVSSDGEIMFDEKKMTRMMGQLSGVLPPLLEAMHPQDWNSCAYRLRRFFLPDPEAW